MTSQYVRESLSAGRAGRHTWGGGVTKSTTTNRWGGSVGTSTASSTSTTSKWGGSYGSAGRGASPSLQALLDKDKSGSGGGGSGGNSFGNRPNRASYGGATLASRTNSNKVGSVLRAVNLFFALLLLFVGFLRLKRVCRGGSQHPVYALMSRGGGNSGGSGGRKRIVMPPPGAYC